MSSTLLTIAALSGFLTVALGAFGAHALRETLDAYGTDIWNKAVLYQMFHTVALLALWPIAAQKNINLTPAAWAFVAGIVLFSGSLYILAVSGVKILGAVTPLGGLSFLFGWGWLAWQAFRVPGN
ncbi:MAG TPA: DUF423 domain-containing protein [Caldithrix abyssi]|uniref:DUF423 domain-containing protein n=1 Tax=Caldithrix abyssi TaxID=187145 RepID=A0A7V1PUN7_CALAY|nr:DUF423 domain-containing protein [Caldithrix abyssi]